MKNIIFVFCLLVVSGCSTVSVPPYQIKSEPFDLEQLTPISLDRLTIVPSLKGWIICDYDVKNERLLAVNYKSREIAVSDETSAWKPDVIRRFDNDKYRVTPLGFLSLKQTAIVCYERERLGVLEEIDLATKAVIESKKLTEYAPAYYAGPRKLSAERKKLAEDIFKEHNLGTVVCFVHRDRPKLLVFAKDKKLFSLDLETKTLQLIDENVYSEGNAEFSPRWAGFRDLVVYFKRNTSTDFMEFYVANTQEVSKRVYSSALRDKKSMCFVSFFVVSPTEAWATLASTEDNSITTGRLKLEYTD